MGNSALLLTRWGTTTGNGQWNSKKLVESYIYKLVCFEVFPTGLQKLGQRANDEWPNGQGQRAADRGQQAEKSKMTGQIIVKILRKY